MLRAVLKVLQTLGLSRFIRTIEEPNKQAMLEEAEIAKTVKGVKIEQHEEFIVKPDQWEAEIVSRSDKLSKKTAS
ncbi:MAG: host-nuclease inhibitor Gam family protein [Parcubacteria group bacterium]|nr:host-nuclease inhibitor Gam family protein [Parcubacteria group bacterium]